VKKLSIFAVFFSAVLAVHPQVKPSWVDNPSAVYPERLYITAVGYGRDRQAAERSGIAALTAFFKQSVSSDISITDREIQVNGDSVSTSRMSQSITASSALDKLIGAEIKNTWNDTRNGLWYAMVVMEKAKCRGLYAGELDAVIREITGLIDLTEGVTFETIARCKKARELAGDADGYALILAFLDGPNRQGEVSRLIPRVNAALDEARAIPVDVRVSGDINGRVRAAFAGAFTALGFKTGNRNSRYALEASLVAAPAAKTVYFNTRYTVTAVLKDTLTGAELFTYSASSRASHPASQEDADNRMIIEAPRKIANEFPEALQDYLDSAY
jgi:hypothetical protein